MKFDQIFTNKADNYQKFRPKYSDKLFELLKMEGVLSSETVAADVGCGTGIFSQQLVDSGATVYGVEPNDAMRDTARRNISSERFIAVGGSAESTNLQAGSVNLVCAAQAFHWFEPSSFKMECVRILQKDGVVLLVWNRKKQCEMEVERKRIVNSYFHVLDVYDYSWDKRLKGISSFFNGKFATASFDNDIVNDYQQFIGRTLSASHALEATDESFSGYLSTWGEYFDKYSRNGTITIPNETVAFWGIVK